MAETLRELAVARSLDSGNFSRSMRTKVQQIKEAESPPTRSASSSQAQFTPDAGWIPAIPGMHCTKKDTLSSVQLESGGDLLSRAVSSQVPSALKGLTSVFGMGTGGTPSPLPPEINIFAWPARFALAHAHGSCHIGRFRVANLWFAPSSHSLRCA